MPKFLENKLKAEYGQNSATPYKVMNAIGAMQGNQETPKGAAQDLELETADGAVGDGRGPLPGRGRAEGGRRLQQPAGGLGLDGVLDRLQPQENGI